MNKRLFISHASEDKDSFVRQLASALQDSGIDVWYDEYEIKPGMSIRESVDRGLASCDAGSSYLVNGTSKRSGQYGS